MPDWEERKCWNSRLVKLPQEQLGEERKPARVFLIGSVVTIMVTGNAWLGMATSWRTLQKLPLLLQLHVPALLWDPDSCFWFLLPTFLLYLPWVHGVLLVSSFWADASLLLWAMTLSPWSDTSTQLPSLKKSNVFLFTWETIFDSLSKEVSRIISAI